jgi:tRNA threonylcarbamoyladenosine biosynthesis protein TsaB
MVTIAINTASKKTAIALVKDEKVLGEKSWQSENDEAEKLMPAIDELIKKHKLKYDDLKKVIVIKGPGSFTGLRVGIAAANTIAFLQKIPIYAIDTFTYLRVAADKGNQDNTLVLFAGKREIYVQETPDTAPELIKLDEAAKKLEGKNLIGELIHEQLDQPKKTFGETIASLPISALKKEKIIKPLYIKGPGISKPKPICCT